VSSSVKKPATFKSVSVNRTFLASKAGISPASSKTADKAAAVSTGSASQLQSGLAPNRPRLVAKAGVGSRDSAPRSGANGGKPGAAPDPNTVWNKNRRKFLRVMSRFLLVLTSYSLQLFPLQSQRSYP